MEASGSFLTNEHHAPVAPAAVACSLSRRGNGIHPPAPALQPGQGSEKRWWHGCACLDTVVLMRHPFLAAHTTRTRDTMTNASMFGDDGRHPLDSLWHAQVYFRPQGGEATTHVVCKAPSGAPTNRPGCPARPRKAPPPVQFPSLGQEHGGVGHGYALDAHKGTTHTVPGRRGFFFRRPLAPLAASSWRCGLW